MLTFLNAFSELLAGMSEKKDGSMRISVSTPENIMRNRMVFLSQQGLDESKVYAGILVHGKKVQRVTGSDERIFPDTDSLVTDENGIFLSVTGADCYPVYFYDSRKKIIGLAHAGWRGAVADIVKATLDEMTVMGSDTKDISVAFGPGICSKHFDVKSENEELFSGWPSAIDHEDGKVHIDLQSIFTSQLMENGISKKNITLSEHCTACEPERFFSYRRDKPEEVEAMMAIIGIV